MCKLLFLIILLGIIIESVNSSRILAVIPTPSYSHQVFFQPLWRELDIRGHDVVVITTDPTKENLQNFKEINISESYEAIRPLIKKMIKGNIWTILHIYDDIFKFVEFQLQLPQMQEILSNKTEHFDLVIVEHLLFTTLGFKHRFNCPMIGVTSFDAYPNSYQAMGNPVHSVLYPDASMPFQENLTFFQRLISYIYANVVSIARDMQNDRATAIVRKYFGSDAPNIETLIDDTDMLFVNANPLLVPLRPFTPSTISVSGMHIKPPTELPKNLQTFLDSAQEGIIYFSLGSNVKSVDLSNDTRSVIMQTFSELPYKVLWKFEHDQLIGKPKNVMILKWVPQQDVLSWHRNVKIFITQAGLQSLEESLYAHIPMVTIPFAGDQIPNAAKVQAEELGVMLDKDKLNVKDLKAAILEVAENPKYKNNVVKFATLMQEQPLNALNKAVWWTEYVLRHKGAQHLKGPQIPAYQYYYLDIFALLSVVFILATCSLTAFARVLYTKMSTTKSKAKKIL